MDTEHVSSGGNNRRRAKGNFLLGRSEFRVVKNRGREILKGFSKWHTCTHCVPRLKF